MRSSSNHTTVYHLIRPLAIAALLVVLLCVRSDQLLFADSGDPVDYLLPWTAEQIQTVTQGWQTGSHTGSNHQYAYDFSLSRSNFGMKGAKGQVGRLAQTV